MRQSADITTHGMFARGCVVQATKGVGYAVLAYMCKLLPCARYVMCCELYMYTHAMSLM